MSSIDRKTTNLIIDYHHYQGDGLARPLRWIRHPDGGKVVLVHFRNAEGVKYSSLDMIANSKDGEYATELFSCERDNEKDMIQTYLEL